MAMTRDQSSFLAIACQGSIWFADYIANGL